MVEAGMILSQKQQLQMKMTPQMLQSIEILQLQMLALEERIYQELADNPTLEILEGPPPGDEPETPEPESPSESSSDDFEKWEDMEREWTDYSGEDTPRRVRSGDEQSSKMDAIQNTAGRGASLQDFLFEQLSYLELTSRERELGQYIIYNINHNGYLQYPLEEILSSIDSEDNYNLEEAEQLLAKVQELEPPGIGARSLVECLMLQLDRMDGDFTVEKNLINNHLADLAANKLAKLSKTTNIPMLRLQNALQVISTLNPKPGLMYSNEPPQYIMPDIVVEKRDNEYIVYIPEKTVPRLQISPTYRNMLSEKEQDPVTKRYVKKKITSARWLIDAIEQRNRTLINIAEYIVDHQQRFFEEGIEHLQPLMMQQVAEALGIHVSTVSRAVNGKYMQTPRGIFAIKYFFARGYEKSDGVFEVDKSIFIKIQNLIETEDRGNPLSDEAIAEALEKQGITIARRTITKYRKMQRIPSSRERRLSYSADKENG